MSLTRSGLSGLFRGRFSASPLAHVPAKWIRFADKDMRQRENLRRIPILPDHQVIR
jgi:hypothetical protein